jgi:hypothetical protein
LTNLNLHANIRISLKKEVVQQTWIVVVKDRERWPTVEVEPVDVADPAQWRDQVPVDRLPIASAKASGISQG